MNNNIFLVLLWIVVVCMILLQLAESREMARLNNENKKLRERVEDLETLAVGQMPEEKSA